MFVSEGVKSEGGVESLKRRKMMPRYTGSKRSRTQDLGSYQVGEVVESPEEIARQYKKYQNAPKFDLNSEELFCTCRKPDHGELMVACDGCDGWFHFKCMNLNSQYSQLIASFYCKFCVWKGAGVTKWKRKCRLYRCFSPIRASSKYCSDEHGLEYMRTQLLERDHGGHDMTPGTIKQVLVHSGDSLEVLLRLGDQFPELPQVEKALEEKTSELDETFPQNIRDSLKAINEKLTDLNASVATHTAKLEYLARIKDIVKIINDKLSESRQDDEGSKKKKSKSKRIDICLYDRTFKNSGHFESVLDRISQDSAVEEEFSEVIRKKLADEWDQDWFHDQLCILERKKCLRHNGWWSLVHDEVAKKLGHISILAQKAESERNQVLRNYSIQIYESGEKEKKEEKKNDNEMEVDVMKEQKKEDNEMDVDVMKVQTEENN